MALVEETSGDEEEGGLDIAKHVENVPSPQLMPKETAKDLSVIDAKVSLFPSGELVLFPLIVDNETSKGAENL